MTAQIKFMMSKANDPFGKHIMLICSTTRSADVLHLINAYVLKYRQRPARTTVGEKTIFRFHPRFLDKLVLTFPHAALSKALRSKLRRAEEKRLEGLAIPRFAVPGFEGELYGYQKLGAKMIFKNEIDLLNDDMGLGKTFQVGAAIKKGNMFPMLFVMPRNVMYTTLVVFRDLFGIDAAVADGTLEERKAVLKEQHEVYICNHDMMRVKREHDSEGRVVFTPKFEDLFNRTWKFACVDEYHNIKNPASLAAIGFSNHLRAERYFGMSGTPVLNRPEEAWVMLHKLYPDQIADYTTFVNGLVIKEGGADLSAYNPDAMQQLRDLLQNRSLRRRKDQVLADLPKKVYMPRQVILNSEQRRIYDEIANDMRMRQADGQIRNIRGALPHIVRLKQACFSPELFGGTPTSSKIDELREIVRTLADNGEKAIVFSQWKAATRIIQREFAEYDPAYVDGSVSLRQREEEYSRFNGDDDCKLYIGTIGANREGINLGSATYVIFTDKGWVPGHHEQAIGRSAAGGLRGIGSTVEHVHVIELIAHDTFEERIEEVLKQKQNIANRLVERDAGSDVKRVRLRDLFSLI